MYEETKTNKNRDKVSKNIEARADLNTDHVAHGSDRYIF